MKEISNPNTADIFYDQNWLRFSPPPLPFLISLIDLSSYLTATTFFMHRLIFYMIKFTLPSADNYYKIFYLTAMQASYYFSKEYTSYPLDIFRKTLNTFTERCQDNH